MLATTPFPAHFAFTPSRPSPLSERHTNTVSRPFTFSMPMNESKTPPPTTQRAYKPNPVLQTRDAATQKRRDMFFRRVQKERDDKKWDARGEQIQRLDYVTEHKRWEAEKARQAPEVEEEVFDEEELPIDTSSHTTYGAPQPEREVQEADDMDELEQWELQRLVASMEEERDNASQHYGSDDEDYDSIFMECVEAGEVQQPLRSDHLDVGMDDVDEMDMS
ncbi:hypothetical protein P280DRAFT_412183 [Massarina eburnea CBS 473.64]|uniref:Uncharacterized protein n=1 Tax=Massarina eburnea CBS 473.64 TaxID=1395130 RepID=A0A6A6RI12_9PLEO|nr:hypothetical protein P280DRAFT_412183 [Massarina eburnea CBS 473.64]